MEPPEKQTPSQPHSTVDRYLKDEQDFPDEKSFEAYILEQANHPDFYETLKSTSLSYSGNLKMLKRIYEKLEHIENIIKNASES